MTAMDSKTLNNNKKNMFLTNYLIKLKEFKKPFIIICVLHLLGMPAVMFAAIMSEYVSEDKYYASAEFYSFAGVLIFIAAMLSGVTLAFSSFRYLYTRAKVDMIYSLPMTIKQRFFSDFLAGFTVYSVPYIGAVILTLLVHFISALALPEYAEDAQYFASSHSFPFVFITSAFFGLLAMLMLYSLTVLVINFCGAKGDAFIYNIVLNGLIPAVIAVTALVFFDDLYGIDIENSLLTAIEYCCPAGGLVFITEYISSLDTMRAGRIISWLAVYILVIAAFIVLAFFLHKKRKAEDVSKPIVFRAFYYVVVSAAVYCIGSLVAVEGDFFITCIVLTFIIYMLSYIALNRGFKGFGFGVLKYIATMAGVFAVCLALNATNGFGVMYYIPSASSVRSVEFENSSMRFGDTYFDGFSSSDDELINAVIDVHKSVLDDYDENFGASELRYVSYESPFYTSRMYYLDFTYYLNSGRKVSRQYDINYDEFCLIIKNIYGDDYKQYIKDDFTEYMNSSLRYEDYYVDVYSKFDGVSENLTVTKFLALKLTEAYCADVDNMSEEDFLNPSDLYGYIGSYPIPESFVNTYNTLLEYNCDLQENMAYDIERILSENIYILSPKDISRITDNKKYLVSDDYSFYDMENKNLKLIYGNSDDVYTLMENARPIFFIEDYSDKYLIFSEYGARMYAVPDEYKDLAESIYNNDDNVLTRMYQ